MTDDVKVDRGDDFQPSPDDVKSAADLADDTKEVKHETSKAKEEEKKTDLNADDKGDDKAEKGGDKSDKKPENRIPQSRVDEMARKNREALQKKDEEIAKLQELANRNKVSEEIETLRGRIDEMDDKYEDLLADGKTAEAKALRKQIRELQDVYNRSIAVANSKAASSVAVEQMRYDTALSNLEAQYAKMNPDHDDFDPEIVDEVIEVMTGLQRSGATKSAALRRAVKYVLGNPPASAEKIEDDAAKVQSLRDEKREEAVKRGLDAASKQPADLSKVGLDSDKAGNKEGKIDVLKLTQAQFAKLDEAQLSKLRGDEL
jgi:hypothetical protein